jgi:hypothetical protein
MDLLRLQCRNQIVPKTQTDQDTLIIERVELFPSEIELAALNGADLTDVHRAPIGLLPAREFTEMGGSQRSRFHLNI